MLENMLSSLWEEESLDACRWGRNSPSGIIKPEWHSKEEHAPTSDFTCVIEYRNRVSSQETLQLLPLQITQKAHKTSKRCNKGTHGRWRWR